MKTLGLIVVLSVGIVAMIIALVPIGVSVDVYANPASGETTLGNLRVAEITVHNQGIVTRTVRLPQLVACQGDAEVPIDAHVGAADTVVRGAGQIPHITVQPGETGTVYLVTRESGLFETIQVFYRTDNFSCLTASNPIASSL
jgi:hypothetical protein